jgi:hypothetical protein
MEERKQWESCRLCDRLSHCFLVRITWKKAPICVECIKALRPQLRPIFQDIEQGLYQQGRTTQRNFEP